MAVRPILRIPAIIVLISVLVTVTPAGAWTVDDVMDNVETPWLSRTAPLNESAEKSGENAEGAEGNEAPLDTDRSSFTFATTTVRTGRVLVESAYSFIDNRNAAQSHSFPELMTRIGVTKRLELRLGWNYEVGGGGDVSNGDAAGDLTAPSIKREAQIQYGFKYALTTQNSWIPTSACIVQAATPTAGVNEASRVVLGYVFGWKIFDDWELDSGIRYETAKEEGDHFNQWAPSVLLKVPVFERCHVHGEYFGIFTDGRATNTNVQYLSPGISYLITPACEVGVRLGWGLNQDAASFFSNVGFGLMF